MASSYPLPFSIYSFRCLAHASAIDCSPRIPRVPKSREPWLLLCTSYAHNTRPVCLSISIRLASNPRVLPAFDTAAAL